VARVRDSTTVLFAVGRTAPPDDPAALERMRRDNADLRELATLLGGVSYGAPTAFHLARSGG